MRTFTRLIPAFAVVLVLSGCASFNERGIFGYFPTTTYVQNEITAREEAIRSDLSAELDQATDTMSEQEEQIRALQAELDELKRQTDELSALAGEAETVLRQVEQLRRANATTQEQVAALQDRFTNVKEETLRALVESINAYLEVGAE